jgi:phage head maturation protease
MEKKYGYSKKSSDGSVIYLKTFEIEDFDVKKDGDIYISEGYANTKNKPDSYGDIPTVYKDNPVYDIKRMKKNPVMLMDHNNSAAFIMGKFIELKEDDKGLYFKNQFRPISDVYNEFLKDGISAFIKGFAKALSIGGRWYFEDEDNPTHLTKASIHEISGVAIGADPRALITTPPKPKGDSTEDSKRTPREELDVLVARYGKNPSRILTKKILNIKQQLQRT